MELGAADWPTFGHDPQRTGSASGEDSITSQNVTKLQLKWSAQVDNPPLALNALTAPVVASHIVTPQGIKDLVYVAGSSDHFFALDADSGKVVWQRTFESAVTSKDEPFYLCPDAVNATPTIDVERNIIYTIAQDGKLYGLDLGSGEIRFGPYQFVPAFAKPWSLNFEDGFVYTATSQGCGGDRSGVYSMDVRNTMSHVTHELLVEAGYGAGMWGRGGPLIGKNGRIILSTGDGKVDPSAGDYGSSFIAASTRNLHLLDYYTPLDWKLINQDDLDMDSGGYAWFAYKDYNLVVGGGKQAVVYLLNADSLGSKDHQTPLFITPPLGNDARALEQKGFWGAPAVWKDETGQPWVYVTLWGEISKEAPKFPLTNGPVPHGCIMAFKVTVSKTSGKPDLEPAWVSPDFNLPDPPVVANGVLFGLATGENPRQTHTMGMIHFKSVEEWKHNLLTTAQRSQGTHAAVLYALDARTGKMLYQSGGSMKSWVHFSGLAVADGKVYAVDHDSNVYCFGLQKEEK
ncbi:MAG TPA: PQQ-binding-like beta-propeller repeat protein [Terriglobia bacterium]|nr:PQQ-binding-like beta-propeller repeat protein [Terriglobia bacterium]